MSVWSNLVKTLADLKGRVPTQYYNPATGEMEVAQGSNGASAIQAIGKNAVVGTYTLTWAASAGANTPQTVPVPLPAVPNGSGLYLVSVNNPTALGTSVTLNFQNRVNFGTTQSPNLQYSTVTSVDVPSATPSEAAQDYLVQGWPYGDADAQILATNDAAVSASGGSVTLVVRAV